MAAVAFLESLSSVDYLEAIQKGLDYIGFNSLVTKDSRIFIKPNLTFPTYRPGVMTNPRTVEAALLAIREYSPHIYIGDSDSGGYNRFSMNAVYKETGLWEVAKKNEVHIVNLSTVERRTITFQYKNRHFSLALPSLLTDEVDFLITMPVPKVHVNTGVSLTFKNQWGCIPEPADRLRLHSYLKHVVLEVNKAVKAKGAIVDGTYGLNVNGPLRGSPVELNWMLITNDIGAGARLACELMQVSLEKIPHLIYARELGFIPDLKEIIINQDLKPFLKQKFVLKRKLTDYPGLLAFKYPLFAYLAYFSPLAEAFHRILYLFREPFYDYRR